MRHLSPSDIAATLRRGRSVEQFLGRGLVAGTIAWLELRPTGQTVSLYRFEVPDIGSSDHLDLYEFGEDDSGVLCITETLDKVLSHAHSVGANPARWANQQVIQDEYGDFISAGRSANWVQVVSNPSLERP